MESVIEFVRSVALSLALANGDATAIQLLEPKQFNCIAVTAYAEARGEGERGMALVVQSIINRANIRDRSACSIARSAYDGYRLWQHRPLPQNERWHFARLVAVRTIAGHIDLGKCASVTHFLNPNAVRRMPSWASPQNRLCRVGNHVAYRVEAL